MFYLVFNKAATCTGIIIAVAITQNNVANFTPNIPISQFTAKKIDIGILRTASIIANNNWSFIIPIPFNTFANIEDNAVIIQYKPNTATSSGS